MAKVEDKFVRAAITRFDGMPKPIKVIFLVLSTIGYGPFILYMFGWSIRGYVLPITNNIGYLRQFYPNLEEVIT